jgi:hypothetical protein
MKKNLWQEMLTPILLLIVFVIAIFGVVNLNKSLKNPPKLTISGPTSVSTTAEKLVVSGQVDPKAKLTVNGKVVKADKSGGYSYTTTLKEGAQTVEVIAVRFFSEHKEKVTITRTPVETKVAATPAETPSKTVASGAVIPASTTSDLSDSGPVESVMGAFGLASLLVCFYLYRKSSKNTLKSSYKAFTTS